MENNVNNSAAEGYRQGSLSLQKLDGVSLIQADVCPKPGDVILDLGCGTGELSAYLAGLVGPEGKVIGVDPDKERIQLARQSHGQINNLSFAVASGASFPEICGSVAFDIIFSNYVLHWISEKQQVFDNMFANLKVGGKVAIQYVGYLHPFVFNGYMILNPENEERICQMYQCEPKATVEQYCSTAGFRVVKSYEYQTHVAFENIESLLKWHWSTTHGVFDLSLVTEERLQRYLAPYTGEDGTPCLDFRAKKEESTVYRLIAVKEAVKCP